MPRYASEKKRQEWKELIEQQSQGGLSVRRWCLENQIRLNSSQYWKSKLQSHPLERSSFTSFKLETRRASLYRTAERVEILPTVSIIYSEKNSLSVVR